MPVPHHTHSGGESGPPINANEALYRLMDAIGRLQVEPARVGESYVGSCFVEPTAGWAPLGQAIGCLQFLEAKADQSFVGSCLAQA